MYNFQQPHVPTKVTDTGQTALYCRQSCEHLYKRMEIMLRPGESYSFSYDGEGTFDRAYYYYASPRFLNNQITTTCTTNGTHITATITAAPDAEEGFHGVDWAVYARGSTYSRLWGYLVAFVRVEKEKHRCKTCYYCDSLPTEPGMEIQAHGWCRIYETSVLLDEACESARIRANAQSAG
ncbi:MAG: hypothetical protein O0V67_05145 [Methanocorpusculum sp.]|nr:hypothetical protein [Methanocorpusculum sp.]